jgi:hypothetical protein
MAMLSQRPAPAMSEAEIWHTAWLMTEFFGGAAAAHQAAMNHARLVQGSPSGEESWQRIAGVLNQIKVRRLKRAVH